jgi:signal transduction histidine kinase
MRFEMKARIGYASVLVLLACGMVLSIQRLASLTNEQTASLRADEREITLVERLRWNSELIVSSGRGYLLSADARLLAKIETAARQFDENVHALRTKHLNEAALALVGDVEAAAGAFRGVQEELLTARRTANDPGALVQRFEQELLPLRAALDRSLDRLVERKEIAMRAAYERARARRDSLALRLYGLVGLLVLIGLVLTHYLSRALGRAYRKERDALAASHRAIAARDEIMGVVAHDLRNPLGAIMMKAELLATSGDLEKVRQQAESIRNVAKRMEHLIASMLDVATLEAGRFTVRTEPCPVAPLVRDVTEMFVAQAASKQVTLDRQLHDRELWVHADRERVIQVLSNLVGNAVKFTPSGGIVAVDVRDEQGVAHFTVSDTGPGIRADDADHVFDRFWKRETGGKKGTGLGLFIAKGIVDAHDGRIWVESAPGKGTRFHFTLPAFDHHVQTGAQAPVVSVHAS